MSDLPTSNKRTIRIGNTGEDVRDAQAKLAHLGYLPMTEVTGVFVVATVRGVIAFQKANNLLEDGLIGPLTWAKLDELGGGTHTMTGDTAGPALEDHPLIIAPTGFYNGAKRVDAHPGRMGGAIKPCAIVVHTTDTMNGSTNAIVRSWSTTPGNGACAHFVIGRDPSIGVIQMISVYRNGNHAGGPIHGNWTTGGKSVHPNVWSVGIEIEAGGRLGKRTDRGFVHPDTKQIVPDAEVFVDERKIGWHLVTEYQLAELGKLIATLYTDALAPMPGDAKVAPDGDYKANGVDYYASEATCTIVGHVTLDPVNKTDPGPQVMAFVRGLSKP